MRAKNTHLGCRAGAATVLCGLLMTVPLTAQTIDGGEVNISGATLFRNFFQSPASTNDFIDVNGDGVFGFDPNHSPFVDQLAPLYRCNGWQGWWLVQYRGVGSVNGLGEFVDSQLLGIIRSDIPSEKGFINRLEFASEGSGTPTGCGCNEHGQDPACCDSNTPYCPTFIDLAVLDVPTQWGVRFGAEQDAAWNLRPIDDGYGFNPVLSDTGFGGQLQSLSRDDNGNIVSLNTDVANPDANTVFDTSIAWVPIAYIANRGTNVRQLQTSDLHYLFVTGRLPGGENLVAATRDAGSGTRNGAMNTAGIDPSWGRGDNLGDKNRNGANANLGPDHQATNAGGSSIMEIVVQNRRLAIGYTGLAGGSRAAADASAGKYEIVDIMFDDRGGAAFVRPNIDTVLDNCDPSTGYQIGGPETFASRGDPNQADPNSVTFMSNQAAADYLRNITGSVAAFAGDPPSDENFNMPGELLALTFFLLDGVDCLPDPSNPTSFLPNAGLNQTLQDFARTNNGLGFGGDTPNYGSINAANLVPKRNANPDFDGDGVADGYSDGSFNGDYTDAGGNAVPAGINLSQRNQVTGDFDNDGDRDWDDIDGLMLALNDPRAFEAGINHGGDQGGMFGDFVIPEVIGDFTGDGNFDAQDVRYFADGLAVDPAVRTLDRREGFMRVDIAWDNLNGSNNFFNTSLATGNAYAHGDSRGDVAGSPTGAQVGGSPTGADGTIDARDIDYICDNFGDWSDINQAVSLDLSADMNGDLIVDAADIAELVQVILGTGLGDVNLDGTVDQADLDIVNANQGMSPAGWADGDLNCDDVVDGLDRDIVSGFLCNSCDMNCDGVTNAFDIEPFLDLLFNGGTPCDSCTGDTNGDGNVDAFDIEPFLNCLFP